MASKHHVACINVLPTLDYIELILIDSKTGEIELSGSLPAPFNPTTRQVEDVAQLHETIKDLYVSNKVPFKTPSVIVVPSFFTREVPLPAELNPEELRMTLVSEAERFFIFKKNEPLVDWISLDNQTILYTAYPKNDIERFCQIFQEQKIPLIAVDLNYFSIYRGLVATGAIQEELQTQDKVCVLVITDFSFFAMVIQGTKIEKTIEAPLSVAGSEIQDIIADIQQDYESFIGYDSIAKLVLVNNATRIPSEKLTARLALQGQLVLIEQNETTLRSRGNLSAQFPCSLEAIGGAFYKQLSEFPSINLLPQSSGDIGTILALREKIQKGLWIANGAVFAVGLLILGLMSLLVWMKEGEMNQLKQSNQQTIDTIVASKSDDLKRRLFVKSMVETNVTLNDLIVKLGVLVPEDLWLTGVSMSKPETDNKRFQVQVKGAALNPDAVNQLRNDLSKALKRTDLEVSKIDLSPLASDAQQYYEWVIQTKEGLPGQPGSPPAGPGG